MQDETKQSFSNQKKEKKRSYRNPTPIEPLEEEGEDKNVTLIE